MSIRAMILYCSYISLLCLYRSVTEGFLHMMCVISTFSKLSDAAIVSRISSKLFITTSALAFIFIVSHIST